MSKFFIAGAQTLTWQGLDFEFSPRHGYVAKFNYRGPFNTGPMYAAYLAANRVPFSYKQNGASVDLGIDGNTAVESGYTEVPIDVWEMPGNELINDWRRHPNSLLLAQLVPAQQVTVTTSGTLQTAITLDVLTAILADYNSVSQGGKAVINTPNAFQIPATVTSGAPPVIYQTGQLYAEVWQLLTNGQDNYQRSQPVLKHIQTVSDNYPGSAGFIFSNIDAVYSPTLLLYECSKFPYPLPALYAAHIAALPVPAAQSGYTVGWLKKSLTVGTKARTKSEVVTEYWYDQWPNYYYAQAT